MPLIITAGGGEIHADLVSPEETPTLIDYLCQSICAPVESGPADDALLSDPRDLPEEYEAEFWHRKHMEAAKALRAMREKNAALRRVIFSALSDLEEAVE